MSGLLGRVFGAFSPSRWPLTGAWRSLASVFPGHGSKWSYLVPFSALAGLLLLAPAIRHEVLLEFSGGPRPSLLSKGISLKRKIRRGEVHWYRLDLPHGTFARIEVDQFEIDLALMAGKSDGTSLQEVDFGPFGREVLVIAANDPAVYRIGVRAAPDSTAAGLYQIRLAEERPLRPEDPKRIRAQATLSQAQRAFETESIPLYVTAARLSAEVGEPHAEAAALAHLGVAYSHRGRWQDAYQCYTRALALAEAFKDEYARLEALRQIGRLEHTLGEHFSFVPSDLEFLRLWGRVGDRRGMALALSSISGYFLTQIGDYQKAIEYAEESIAIQRALGDRKGEGRSLEGLVMAQTQLGEYKRALETALTILHINQTTGDQRGEAASLGRIGFILDRLKQYREAKTYYEQELRLREAQGDLPAQDVLHDMIAAEDLSLHEPFEALPHLRASLALEDSMRQDLSVPKWREGFSGHRLITSLHIRTLLALDARDPGAGYGAEAFLAVDRAHGRLLVERAQELAGFSLADIQKKLLDEDTILLEYSLGRDDSDQSDCFLWVVTAKSLRVHRLPRVSDIERLVHQSYDALSAPGHEYAEVIHALSRILLRPVGADLRAKRLLIASEGSLQYVPFSVLVDPALPPGAPLASSHEIEYLPSAAAALALSTRRAQLPPPSRTLALIADPVFNRDDPRLSHSKEPAFDGQAVPEEADLERAIQSVGFANAMIPRLPYSRQEARWALRWVPPKDRAAFLDFSASRDLIMTGQLRDYRIVHFATHGLLNDADPDLSGLLLSRINRNGMPIKGFLRLSDLYTVQLPASLVVLSTCESAVGKVFRGEGMLSLTTGFLYAGAGSVLATLWKVNDEASAEFMKAFYAELLGPHRLPAGAALQAAQMALYKNPRWHSPYYWAAFVLRRVEP